MNFFRMALASLIVTALFASTGCSIDLTSGELDISDDDDSAGSECQFIERFYYDQDANGCLEWWERDDPNSDLWVSLMFCGYDDDGNPVHETVWLNGAVTDGQPPPPYIPESWQCQDEEDAGDDDDATEDEGDDDDATEDPGDDDDSASVDEDEGDDDDATEDEGDDDDATEDPGDDDDSASVDEEYCWEPDAGTYPVSSAGPASNETGVQAWFEDASGLSCWGSSNYAVNALLDSNGQVCFTYSGDAIWIKLQAYFSGQGIHAGESWAFRFYDSSQSCRSYGQWTLNGDVINPQAWYWQAGCDGIYNR